MASEYLKWKYRDVKPEEERTLTAGEKRRNWLHYHKGHIAVGLALLAAAGGILWDVISQVKPDYRIAYVGVSPLPDDTVKAVEAGIAALGEDLNGDGRVTVQLTQYPSGADAGADAASRVRLTADVMECESFFFLLENPEEFQRAYQVLCFTDGTLPQEDDLTAAGTYWRWERCPVLAGLELGTYAYELLGQTVTGSSSDLLSGLCVARRGFWTDKSAPYPEGCQALWEKITEGAVS